MPSTLTPIVVAAGILPATFRSCTSSRRSESSAKTDSNKVGILSQLPRNTAQRSSHRPVAWAHTYFGASLNSDSLSSGPVPLPGRQWNRLRHFFGSVASRANVCISFFVADQSSYAQKGYIFGRRERCQQAIPHHRVDKCAPQLVKSVRILRKVSSKDCFAVSNSLALVPSI